MRNFEQVRKRKLLEHIYKFDQTNDMMELAEVYVDIQNIFKAEDFPIDLYIKSKARKHRKRMIKLRNYKPK